MKSAKAYAGLFALSTLLAPSAAGAADYHAKAAADVDISAYETYAWNPHSDPVSQGFDDDVREAVDEVLGKRGLELVDLDADPDLWVHYEAGTVDELGAGLNLTMGWFGETWLDPGVRVTVHGALTVLVRDSATDELVWGGLAEMDGANPNALQVMMKRAPRVVRKLMRRFPRRDARR